MSKIKILHTADLHLNAPFYGLDSEAAAIRKEEQKNVLSNIIDLVISNGADVLLIAGDLFNTPDVPMQTASFVKKCFERISNVPIFISPGNHDYLSQDSVYNSFDFGSNVHVFKDSLDFCEIKEKNVRIWGYGFPAQNVTKSCIDTFACPDDEYSNILVMHGEIANEGVYNPTTAEMLERAGFDYIALGHVHAYEGICFKGNTAYAYSGMPEGLYFDEPGSKGVIIGEVDKGFTALSFAKTSKRENVTVNVDISGCETYDSVTEKIKTAMLNAENLYKIVLEGEIGEEIYFDKNILKLKNADAAFFVKIVDETQRISKFKTGSSALAKAFEEILKSKQLDDLTYKKALEYGMRALEGREV